MRLVFLLVILCCLSCNNERVLQLPEIEISEITEVLDVSPAYIFYDEAQPDSTLLNRKNLIITTNWLVNVDKRLTLRQALPHIKFLQDKKRNAEMHKNEAAKNYFTCNDTSIGNLGFIEFTNVNFDLLKIPKDSIRFHASQPKSLESVVISENPLSQAYLIIDNANKDDFKKSIKSVLPRQKEQFLIEENIKITGLTLSIYLDKHLSFQDYISIKSRLLNFESDTIIIKTNEFIY